MTASDRSLLSSYREMLLEHLFAGEVMRHVWLSGAKRRAILKMILNESVILGLLGGVAGILIAFFLSSLLCICGIKKLIALILCSNES